MAFVMIPFRWSASPTHFSFTGGDVRFTVKKNMIPSCNIPTLSKRSRSSMHSEKDVADGGGR